jgi:hypothetical protein
MRRKALWSAITALLIGSSWMRADVLDFEDRPAGTRITAEYAAQYGVVFSNAYIDNDPNAHSSTRVLRSRPLSDEVFEAIPMVMTFTSVQAHIRFFAQARDVPLSGTLNAFDADGNLVAHDGPKPVAANVFSTAFEVTVPAASIRRAEFVLGESAFQAIDDLELSGEPPAPVPTQPPVVQITSPPNSAELDVANITIQGTVTGDAILSPGTLTMQWGRPPESTAPPFTSALDLTQTGATWQFSFPFNNVPLGPITVTVTAKNLAALEGTAVSVFTNLPADIQDRFDQDGGAATFGDFRFGATDTGCVAAVYERGLIARFEGAIYIVRGLIFQKWMAMREPGSPMSKLGCPKAEERDVLGADPERPSPLPGRRAQDFVHGRIYTDGVSAAYVPEVFRDALEALGGEQRTGIATADPTDSVGPMQTWLFQRFTRVGYPIEDSTLEIRGSPPVLYVERVGDDLIDLGRAGLAGPGYSSVSPRTATLVHTFQCTGNLGPCHVQNPGHVNPQDPIWRGAGNPPSIVDGGPYCGGVYPFDTLTEWHAMGTSNYTQTPFTGWVVNSKAACIDNPLTHDHSVAGCALPDWAICAQLSSPFAELCCGLLPPPLSYGCLFYVEEHQAASDWEVYLSPILPSGGIRSVTQTYFELEFETHYAGFFFTNYGWPIKGDLVHTSGRWIIDCGHDTFKSEIHPPFMVTHVRTEKPAGGEPETVAEIWVNGYFPGEPIELDLWAPPRPSPDALLTVSKPVDAESALGLNIATTISAPGVHLRFTAPHREVGVEQSGKMKWEAGRGYYGEWKLHWSRN